MPSSIVAKVSDENTSSSSYESTLRLALNLNKNLLIDTSTYGDNNDANLVLNYYIKRLRDSVHKLLDKDFFAKSLPNMTGLDKNSQKTIIINDYVKVICFGK